MGTTIPKHLADWVSRLNLVKKIKEWEAGLKAEEGHYSSDTKFHASWDGQEVVVESLEERLNWHLDQEEETFRDLIHAAFSGCQSEDEAAKIYQRYSAFLADQRKRVQSELPLYCSAVAVQRLHEWANQLESYASATQEEIGKRPVKRRQVHENDGRRRGFSHEQRSETVLMWKEISASMPLGSRKDRIKTLHAAYDSRMKSKGIFYTRIPSIRTILVWAGEGAYR